MHGTQDLEKFGYSVELGEVLVDGDVRSVLLVSRRVGIADIFIFLLKLPYYFYYFFP